MATYNIFYSSGGVTINNTTFAWGMGAKITKRDNCIRIEGGGERFEITLADTVTIKPEDDTARTLDFETLDELIDELRRLQ